MIIGNGINVNKYMDFMVIFYYKKEETRYLLPNLSIFYYATHISSNFCYGISTSKEATVETDTRPFLFRSFYLKMSVIRIIVSRPMTKEKVADLSFPSPWLSGMSSL